MCYLTEDRPRTDSPLAGIDRVAADGLRTRRLIITNKELAFILNFRMIDRKASSRWRMDNQLIEGSKKIK